MYRGITLTPVVSKLFESVLALFVYGEVFKSDELQFSFKQMSSCNHALFTSAESVKYFNKRE